MFKLESIDSWIKKLIKVKINEQFMIINKIDKLKSTKTYARMFEDMQIQQRNEIRDLMKFKLYQEQTFCM